MLRLGLKTKILIINHHFDLLCLLNIYRVIKGGKFDLVHTHLIHGDFYGLVAAYFAKVKTKVSSRHNDNPFRKKFPLRLALQWLYKLCTHTIVISEQLKIFVYHIEKIPLNSITVIHYGLEIGSSEKAKKLEIKPVSQRKKQRITLVSVGRLIEQKGHYYLLQAMHHLALKSKNVRLTIVGDGPLRNQLEDMRNSLGIENMVDFVGWQSNVYSFYESADILIHPSLWEGFGLVLLEAMRSGLPIIASNVSAVPEIVEDLITGLLVSPADSLALEEAITDLIDNSKKRTSLGKNGYERLKEKFAVEPMVRKTEHVYDQLHGL